MRCLSYILVFIALTVNLGWVSSQAEANSVAKISEMASEARRQVKNLKRTGWTTDKKLEAIQILGPSALQFVAIPNLAKAVKTDSGKNAVRRIYDTLHSPLNDIYEASFNRLDQMTADVIAADGDLEAVQDSQAYLQEQGVVSRSLYFLNWLNYIGSFTLEGENKEKGRSKNPVAMFSHIQVSTLISR